MTRSALTALAIALTASAIVAAQRGSPPARGGAQRGGTTQRGTPAKPPAPPAAVASCAADLGAGSKSHRPFCDVILTTDPDESVVMTIPPHRGAATLRFDLHNRFTIPIPDVEASQRFARHLAVVAVIRANGTTIERAAVAGEFRRVGDLFDQITGGGPGGLKIIAPGKPESVVITIPAGVSSIGIVGVRLDVTTIHGRTVFDTPGRPVAIVSALRLEYTPIGQ